MPSVIFLMGCWNAPSERFLYRQMQMLREAGRLECIVSALLAGDTEWEGIPVFGLANRGFSCDTGPSSPRPDPQHQIARFRAIVRASRADVILCQYGTIASLLFPVLIDVKQRLIIHFHGKDSQEEMHPPEYKVAIETLAQRARVLCGPEVSERLTSWMIPNKILKTYGVEVPAEVLIRAHRQEVTILHVGRLVDCKGPDRTIQAFDKACEMGLEGRLVIIGDGPLRATCDLLREQSRWRDAIALKGFVPQGDLEQARRDADIFTLHSMKGEHTGQIEAFGVAVVEAMAAALPVVSCAIGGVRHIVRDGITGILVEPGNVLAQAEALTVLARNSQLRRVLGEAGWREVRMHYSYQTEKKQLLDALFG